MTPGRSPCASADGGHRCDDGDRAALDPAEEQTEAEASDAAANDRAQHVRPRHVSGPDGGDEGTGGNEPDDLDQEDDREQAAASRCPRAEEAAGPVRRGRQQPEEQPHQAPVTGARADRVTTVSPQNVAAVPGRTVRPPWYQ
jgi:hypothetical protein